MPAEPTPTADTTGRAKAAKASGGATRRPPLSRRRAGAGAVLVLAILCYFIFGGRLPWASSPFVLRATFSANTNLHIPSPVRMAGVQVGEVTGVSPIPGSATAGTITMALDPSALPIHAGATATIRSRTFLEGNFYVALTAGNPSAPNLSSGSTLPVAQTAGPVQLDRVLSSLTEPVRANLQTVLQGLGNALSGGGAQAVNRSLVESGAALRASAIVNQALLGQRPGDLSGAVQGLARTFSGLAASRRELSGFVTSFTATMSTLAARQGDLSATLAALPGALTAADRADLQLNGTLPALGRVSTDLVPALHQLGPTIATSLPWLGDLTTLADGRHLGGLLTALTPAVQDTRRVIGDANPLLGQLDNLARCTSRDLVPTGNETVTDPGASPDGQKAYLELLQSFVGLTSASQNFDGNGRYLRASTGGGNVLIQTKSTAVNGPLFANAVLNPLGSRPLLPGTAPAVDTTTPCATQAAPDLNAAGTGGTP